MTRFMHPLESRQLLSGSVVVVGNTLVVNGTSGADRINVGMGINTVVTTIGGERTETPLSQITAVEIYGSSGDDVIGMSNDMFGCYINAGPGNDIVVAGDGKDTLTGGAGRNTLVGQAGDDRLNGSNGKDSLIGNDGADRLYGNGGNDTLDGSGGVDRLFGGNGDDVLTGGGSNDKLYAEAGNDSLHGKTGADLCDGGTGIDKADQDGSDSLFHIEKIKAVVSPASLAGKYKGTWPLPGNPAFPNIGQFQLSITATGGAAIQGTFTTSLGTGAVLLTGTTSGSKFNLGYTSPFNDIEYAISITGTLAGNQITGFASVKGTILAVEGNFSGTRV